MKKTVLCLALICISTYVVHGASVNSLCSDDTWSAFEDEKCVKLIRTFATHNMAEQMCNMEWSTSSVPTLVTIRSAAEQKFLSEYVFKYSDANNIWIGAERRPDSTTEFDWNDGSSVQQFSNWAVGRPSNDTRRSCVQMQTELSIQVSDMQWADVACSLGNWFICQKLQIWPLHHIQQAILDGRREREYLTNKLDLVKNELKELQETFIMQMANVTNQLNIAYIERRNLQNNSVPIGFIYVQLQNQLEPSALWTNVTWTEITESYAGLFFRAVGGGSAAFGSIQDDNSPRLTNVGTVDIGNIQVSIGVNANSAWSAAVTSGGRIATPTTLHWGLRFIVSQSEVRPRNTAMRIWIRTA